MQVSLPTYWRWSEEIESKGDDVQAYEEVKFGEGIDM